MKNYEQWPQKNASVTNLRLDPRNPRIPSGDADLSQRELIEELVEHDDVYGLAKYITTRERPLVMPTAVATA